MPAPGPLFQLHRPRYGHLHRSLADFHRYGRVAHGSLGLQRHHPGTRRIALVIGADVDFAQGAAGKAEAAGNVARAGLEALNRHALRIGLNPGALLATQTETYAAHGQGLYHASRAADAGKVASFENKLSRALPANRLSVAAITRALHAAAVREGHPG